MVSCEACGTLTKNKRFCSRSCSAKVTNSEVPRRQRQLHEPCPCLTCGATIPFAYYARKFCSHQCAARYKRESLRDPWFAGKISVSESMAKFYMIERYGLKCQRCGWCEVRECDGVVPVQLEHIDGNDKNNFRSNVKLLCPSCRALTPTWGYSRAQR